MKSIAFISLTLVASTAAALPPIKATSSASGGSVYYCTQPDWTGPCQLSIIKAGECFTLPSTYSENIFSIGADEGTTCFLMQDQCNAEEPYADISYPGYADLSTANLEWYQFVTSIFCE
ncbi:hypothetical protein LTR65_000172 [Meristemomyces frigidus]